MKDPEIIVKDIYKPSTDAERHKELTKSIIKLVKSLQEKETIAQSNKNE